MKKIRCLKDAPFCKAGEIFDEEVGCHRFEINGYKYDSSLINLWISEGWFEYVSEKKSLEDKFNCECVGASASIPTASTWIMVKSPKELAQIAADHYNHI